MNAIYLTKYGKSESAFEMRKTPIPKAGPGEVIIKVKVSGLNFADVMARRGMYPDAPKNPTVLGYDVSGTVYETGEGAEHFEFGQEVFALTRFGGYAEYVRAQVEAIAPIPGKLNFESATALAIQACTAYFCAEEAVKLHAGDHVLIQAAAGGVGINLVQIAQQKGCIVYGTASTAKQNFLRQLRVDVPIDYSKEDFTKIIQTQVEGIDVVFDSLGGKTFKKGFKLLNPGGRIVSFGGASQIKGNRTNKVNALKMALGFGIFSPIQLLMNSSAIIGVNMLRIADHRPHVFQQCLQKVCYYVDQEVINPIIAKNYKASDIASAHQYLESRKSIGKVNIVWD